MDVDSPKVEGIFGSMIVRFVPVYLVLLTVGCASLLEHKESHNIKDIREFDKAITVKELPAAPSVAPEMPKITPILDPEKTLQPEVKPSGAEKKKAKKPEKKPKPPPPLGPQKHQPELEDSEGFDTSSLSGRRPLIDPFRPGEKTTMEVSFFAIKAGTMTIEVRPFVEVNGRKSYVFAGTAKSYGLFDSIYVVDDWFESYVDFEKLIPFTYSLHVKESKQLREVRSLFDWSTRRAFFWEKKVTKDKGLEESKKEWDLPLWSQNVFTILYYARVFQLKPGKRIAMRMAHEGENLIVYFDVIRKEVLETDAGTFNTVVVKPTIEIDGVFKPVGDIFLWITDDDRKFLVKLESKLKIGSIKAMVTAIEPGQ